MLQALVELLGDSGLSVLAAAISGGGVRRGGENDHQIPPDNPNVGMIVHKSRIRKGMHQVVLALAVFRV
jgi:hypothetical protein